MSLADFLAPLRRKKNTFGITFVILLSLIFGGIHLFPKIEKTTIYFSLKPLTTENDTYVLSNGIEEGSKVAETIAGWAKNPAFREEILNDAQVKILNFKRKITAQKQNRLNVFWTLKLYGDEIAYSERIRTALMDNLAKNFKNFNENNAFPFGYSEPGIFTENLKLPLSWKLLISFFTAFFLSFIGFFLLGAWQGRLLFTKTVKEMFPDAPVLKISEKIGSHDKKLLEHFLNTFDSPKFISAFPEAEKFFSLENLDSFDFQKQSPIILIRLWDTHIEDLENLEALFGKNIAMVLFEQ